MPRITNPYMHVGTYRLQIGAASAGATLSKADSWYGDKTDEAALWLIENGPESGTSAWAIETIQKGLDDLGYYIGPPSGVWDDETIVALKAVRAAQGAPYASFVPPELDVPPPGRDEPPANVDLPSPSGTIVQSGKVVDTIMLHTTATPGDFLANRTFAEGWESVCRFHTTPKSQGGRGWSAPGYHRGYGWRAGERADGRPFTRMGAGALGWNHGVIHLTMFPTQTIKRMHDDPRELYTETQIDMVRKDIEEICKRTPIVRVMTHNEVAAKLCMGTPCEDGFWTSRAVA